MKKIIVALVVCFTVLLSVGCGAEQKTMKCSRTMNQNDASLDLQYEVLYTGENVDIVKSTEKITSENKELLETYKETVEEQYKPYKDIEHYNYSVSIDGNVLTSTTNIDYNKINTAKMIEVDSANSQLIKDGKVKLETIEALYKQMGITCEK